MNEIRKTYAWEEPWTEKGWSRPPGEVLAALRLGYGREPGSVPSMWAHYRHLNDQGDLGPALRAEHACLVLYGFHQQGQSTPMHDRGRRIGQALAILRGGDENSALDRRVSQAATAVDLPEVTHHLRGLIGLMKAATPSIGFDYTSLREDLTRWQRPDGQALVRRRWGRDYFNSRQESTKQTGKDNS